MKNASFMGEALDALGIFVVKIIVEPKIVRSVFFVIDDKPTYYILFERDWIYTSQCLPSTKH